MPQLHLSNKTLTQLKIQDIKQMIKHRINHLFSWIVLINLAVAACSRLPLNADAIIKPQENKQSTNLALTPLISPTSKENKLQNFQSYIDPTPTKVPPIVRTGETIPARQYIHRLKSLPHASSRKSPSQTNILLLGDDQRPYESGCERWHHIGEHYTKKTLSFYFLSLVILCLCSRMDNARINVIYQRGGFDLLSLTFAYNFGIQLIISSINICLENLIDHLGH
jgi:hypothetical protein